MASMAKGEWTLLTLVSELVSLAIFAYLVGLAARILVPDGRWLTLAAVLGDSIAVLLAAQLVRADSPAWLMVGAGALPVALFAGAVGCYLYPWFDRASRRPLRLTDAQIGFLFTLLGITAFSTVVALGLLVARAITPLDAAQAITPRDVAIVLQRLSVLVAMTAVPLLAGWIDRHARQRAGQGAGGLSSGRNDRGLGRHVCHAGGLGIGLAGAGLADCRCRAERRGPGICGIPLASAGLAHRRHRLRGLGLPHRVLPVDRQTDFLRGGPVRRETAAAHDQCEERDGVGRPVRRPGCRLRTLGASGSPPPRRDLSRRLRRRGSGRTVVGHRPRRPDGRGRRLAGRDPVCRLWRRQPGADGPLAPPRTELPGVGSGHVGRVVGIVVAVGRAPRRTALGRRAGDRSARHGRGCRSPAALREPAPGTIHGK